MSIKNIEDIKLHPKFYTLIEGIFFNIMKTLKSLEIQIYKTFN